MIRFVEQLERRQRFLSGVIDLFPDIGGEDLERQSFEVDVWKADTMKIQQTRAVHGMGTRHQKWLG